MKKRFIGISISCVALGLMACGDEPATMNTEIASSIAPVTTGVTAVTPVYTSLVATYSGAGDTTTALFTLTNPAWQSIHICERQDPANPAMSFSYYIYSPDNDTNYFDGVTNISEPGSGSLIQYSSGRSYYIKVTAVNTIWTVSIWD